ncbi:MAG: pirin family protein [Sulfuricella sp.]|nr:pirin family protein [Sulfuricella sp.]
MIRIRKHDERGHFDHGWLNTWHTFSFGDYHDPAHVGFSTLRVINDDRVAPGAGFPTHGHSNMEIITYVMQGALAHKDSMGTGSVIQAGDVQYMSAGSGVTHSEFNASAQEMVHLLQIWIFPKEKSLPPLYRQKHFSAADKRGKWCLIASPDGAAGSLEIRQDARLFAALIDSGTPLDYPVASSRRLWLHVAQGSVSLAGIELQAGDGAAVEGENAIRVESGSQGEVLLFDLA